MSERIPANESEGRRQCPEEFAFHDTSDTTYNCMWMAGHPGQCKTCTNTEWTPSEIIRERVRRVRARQDAEPEPAEVERDEPRFE